MSKILVDTSIWIDYFKGKDKAFPLIELIEGNRIVTNDLILAELLPSINKMQDIELRDLLLSLPKAPLQINWQMNIEMQKLFDLRLFRYEANTN